MRRRWTATAEACHARAARALAPVLAATGIVCAPRVARAQQAVDVHADQVQVDVKLHELDLVGHVRADAPPFHLSAERLRLTRSRRGVEVQGDGKLTFCPCLGTPLTVAFKRATVAPPGDLLLSNASLRIYGLPILWLPFFWLRAPTRVGLLPPEIAYRGADGFFLGGGVHVPLGARRGEALDLRAGGYFLGGFAVDASARTATTSTHVRFDRLATPALEGLPGDGNGLLVDARGALTPGPETLAWDVDTVLGARGLDSVVDLDTAARPYDTAAMEASVHGPFVVSTGLRAVSERGGELLAADVGGPVATVGRSGAIGSVGTYDATIDAGVFRLTGQALPPGVTDPRALSFARGDAGVLLAGRAGPVGVRATMRAAGDVGSDGVTDGLDGAASARLEAGLPLVRGIQSADAADPWRHRVEPLVSVAGLVSRGDELLGLAPGRGLGGVADGAVDGRAVVADVGVRSALGRWGAGLGLQVAGAGGVAVGSDGAAVGVVRWRAAASLGAFGLDAEGGDVLGRGHVVVAAARVGRPSGLHLRVSVAGREEADPVLARALVDAPLEPSAGFLAREGWTGGVRAGIPWTSFLVTRGGVDMDLGALVPTAAVGSVELRDKCGCFAFRVTGAHRLGRDGVDVWASVDFVPR